MSPVRVSRRQVGTRLLASALFIVSYAPVLAIFAVMSDTAMERVVYGAFFIIVIGLAFALTYGMLGDREKRIGRSVVVEDKGSEVSGYLASYLLPFLTGPPQGWGEGLGYMIYFVTAAIIYVNSDLLLVNPTLYAIGWRVCRATDGEMRMYMLTRELPRAGRHIDYIYLPYRLAIIRSDRGDGYDTEGWQH